MERKLRFRAWDGEKMIYPDSTTTQGSGSGVFVLLMDMRGVCSWNNPYGFAPEKRAHVEIMQFIGMADKNGTEIYEGDILQIKTAGGRVEKFTVERGIHRREMRSGYTVDIPSFAFVSSEGFPSFPIVDNYLGGHDLEIIEVIGNIYQNRALIEKP